MFHIVFIEDFLLLFFYPYVFVLCHIILLR